MSENETQSDPMFTKSDSVRLAFSYGMELVLRAYGDTLNPDTLVPILQMMQKIVEDPKNSLIRWHDDDPMPIETVKQLRDLEHELCKQYLEGCPLVNQSDPEPDNQKQEPDLN